MTELPDADESRMVRAYRKFLIQATGSKLMDQIEKKVLNYICPKSVILYAEKPALHQEKRPQLQETQPRPESAPRPRASAA